MNKIYARNTTAIVINDDIAQEFIENNHKSGAAKENFKRQAVGLLYNNDLVAVAQFCTPRTSAKKRLYTTELLRLCFLSNIRVVGGASKLISYYINTYQPADIFTYQDTTGENTDVYEKCGFTLVSSQKNKKYLIAPNKTIETANRKNNEILSIPYVVRFGPDNILGTNLGEVFNENGLRKNNIELFTDVLGWSIIETSGDKIYEWFNKNKSFYTYKITASDSDKYYYGVSSIKIPFEKLTIEDCLNDHYYGSGGNTLKNNKFKNWKNKHKKYLIKEIINIFPHKAEAYEDEKMLIGELWKNDARCLNSAPGGVYTGFNKSSYDNTHLAECPTHGLVKHRGNKCYMCFMNDIVSLKDCSIHGLTKHQGDSCCKCSTARYFSEQECDRHGLVTFMGNKCKKCIAERTIVMKDCPIHGLTKHQGDSCNKCNANKSVNMRECSLHGHTKFVGSECRKCISDRNKTLKNCLIHGETIHNGDSCRKCASEKTAHTRWHKNEKKEECRYC